MKTKYVVALISILILVGGIVVGAVLIRSQVGKSGKAAPSTSLSITGPLQTIYQGQEFTSTIDITTGENYVAGTELLIRFDPSVLEVISITPSSFLVPADTVGPVIDNQAGTVYFVILLPPGADPKQGSGELASMKIKAKSPGTSQLSFDSGGTLAVALHEGGQNVIQNLSPTTITVASSTGGGDATPSPSPTPEATDTPTPSATASPTSTPASSASASPSPTSSPTIPPISEIPDTGVSLPTIVGFGVGLMLIVGSFALFY